jgi:hypothetical protein
MQRDGLAVENDDDFPELLQSYAIIATELRPELDLSSVSPGRFHLGIGSSGLRFT